MLNQRGNFSIAIVLILAVIILVGVLANNSATMTKLNKYQVESAEQDLMESLKAVSIALSESESFGYSTQTSLATLDIKDITISNYLPVVNLSKPNVFFLTETVLGEKFLLTETPSPYINDSYELLSNVVVRDLRMQLAPSNDSVLNKQGLVKTDQISTSFNSTSLSEVDDVDIIATPYSKLETRENKPGLMVGYTLDSLELNDRSKVKVFYPTKVGAERVEVKINTR